MSYWLIERQIPYHCEWYVGDSGRETRNWTTDASKAMRFVEWGAKYHAEQLESWGAIGPFTVTEHVDVFADQTFSTATKEVTGEGL